MTSNYPGDRADIGTVVTCQHDAVLPIRDTDDCICLHCGRKGTVQYFVSFG